MRIATSRDGAGSASRWKKGRAKRAFEFPSRRDCEDERSFMKSSHESRLDRLGVSIGILDKGIT